MAANLSIAPGFYNWYPVPQYGPNELTPAQSDFEDGSTGSWAVNANCTLANSVAQANTGTHSMTLTSVAAGVMSAISPAGVLGGFPVIGGQGYVCSAFFRASTAGRGMSVQVQWLDTAGNVISTTALAGGADVTTAWTQFIANAVAPANAFFARLILNIGATGGAGEVHFVDTISFNPGIFYPL